MAETGKKGQERTTAPVSEQGAQDPDVTSSAIATPTPRTTEESDRASLRVTPAWPISSFVVEDIPEIKVEGTMLTKSQFKKAEESAKASGVALRSEEVK